MDFYVMDPSWKSCWVCTWLRSILEMLVFDAGGWNLLPILKTFIFCSFLDIKIQSDDNIVVARSMMAQNSIESNVPNER